MSFEPSIVHGSVTTLSPFRYWCQKVLPLVYDNSLSYYELLCKVVEYLNETMENVNTVGENTNALYNSYLELVNYVNTYFDNLDVQYEINNKLDEMVESGELSNIIKESFGYLFEENYRPKYVYVKNSGSDDNDGLTAETAMKTIENAYRKYANHKYINIHIMESGEYNLGEGLEFGQEFLMNGHSSVIAAYTDDVVLTGNMYWLSGNIELWDLNFNCYGSFRANNLVLKNCVVNGEMYIKCPFLMLNSTFNNILNIGSCAGEFRECVFNETENDRVKITVSNSNVSFATSLNINTTIDNMKEAFIRNYGGTQLTFECVPDFTGKYNVVVWNNCSEVDMYSDDIYQSFRDNSVNPLGVNNFNNGRVNCSLVTSIGARPVNLIGYNQDLNNFLNAGVYLCHVGTLNNPAGVNGVLTISYGYDNMIEQKLDVVGATEVAFYIRKYNKANSTWTSWYKFTGTAV